jgi:hypothetical protein
MCKSTRRLTVLTAAVLPILTLTTAALADDDKNPGAMCRPIAPLTNPQDSPGLGSNGSMLNFSRAEQAWICPAVRSHMGETAEFARITVQENGITPVDCKFEARDPMGKGSFGAGTPSKTKQEIINANPPTLAVMYTWGSGEIDAMDPVPDHGYYFFTCMVPGRTDQNALSGVITYKVSEND